MQNRGDGVIDLTDPQGVPRLRQVVLDCTGARALAEFYQRLLGLVYRPGEELPEPGVADERGAADWLVLKTPGGVPQLAFQQVGQLLVAGWVPTLSRRSSAR